MISVNMENYEISRRVKDIIGIPDVFIKDEVITSPDFKDKSELYIKKQLKEIQNIDIDDDTQKLIEMAYIYYISYLLCITMPVRLPVRMENISTKTLLQTMNWSEVSSEMIGRCNELLNDILEDEGIVINYNTTVVGITNESSYPNTQI